MFMKNPMIFVAAALGISSLFAESSSPTMKAIVIHQYGGLEVLKYEDAPRPEPKEDEMLIHVMAASVNPVDVAIRSGEFAQYFHTKLPLIPGMDAAGIVEKAGAAITKFKKGDPVYAFFTLKNEGGYGQFVIAKENETSAKPKSLTYEEAAAVPAVGSTAWQALVETAGLKAGQTVLIHGGSGGVGHCAIQIAKAKGARVIATASTANQEFLKKLGADQAIDYTTTKFESVVKDVDVVLDAVGGDTLTRSYDVVKKGGVIVSIAGEPDEAALKKRGIRAAAISAVPKANVLEELTKLIDAKKLTPVVTKVFPLPEAAKAQEAIATGHTRGKIILKVGDELKA